MFGLRVAKPWVLLGCFVWLTSCRTAEAPPASTEADAATLTLASLPAVATKEISSARRERLVALAVQYCALCHKDMEIGTVEERWGRLQAGARHYANAVAARYMPPLPRLPDPERAEIVSLLEEIIDQQDHVDPLALPLDRIQLPPGFHIDLFARVPQAGAMSLAESFPANVLAVGTGGEERQEQVYGVQFANGRHRADRVAVVADKLSDPLGVAYYPLNHTLYVAEKFGILKAENFVENFNDGKVSLAPLTADFPREGQNSAKYLRIGPDHRLYVPVGFPCNVCNPDADSKTRGKFGRMFRFNLDGKGKKEVAKGIRHTLGFDWDPITQNLWFTDDGREEMGDNLPPDELNRVVHIGDDFGFPYCHGAGIVDPDFGHGDCRTHAYRRPEQALGAHVAAEGMSFYTGHQFPDVYYDQIFIAEHGSLARSDPSGYRISLVRLDPRTRKVVSYEPFATGWLGDDGVPWGSPNDIKVSADGSLLVSDDLAGAIYRIWYEPAPH